MVLGAYREIELDEARPFNQVLPDLNREGLANRVKLKRFSRNETQEMLAVLFAEEITEPFLDGIFGETEGNPFFIEEVSKALAESGKLKFENGRWDRPSMDELEIPQSVRVAIQSRMNKLPTEVNQTLQMAAILGREFKFETLVSASEMDENILIDALDIAERNQLIEEIAEVSRDPFPFSAERNPGEWHGEIVSFIVRAQKEIKLTTRCLSTLKDPKIGEVARRTFREAANKSVKIQIIADHSMPAKTRKILEKDFKAAR